MTSVESEAGRIVPDPRPAPEDLEGLRLFVNSDNRYHGIDYFVSDDRAAWFSRFLPGLPVDEIDDGGWRRLVELRALVRSVIAREQGAAVVLSKAAQRYPMVAAFAEDARSRLDPLTPSQEGRLAVAVLAALHGAVVDGRFERLRLCARPDCGWCFYDSSRSRTARWCSSDPCGDVMKTRAYRERRRTTA